jgi:hypothetical protein
MVLLMSGFQFSERMSGTVTHEGRERSFSFTCNAKAPSLWRHLRDHVTELDGHVDMEGFATRAPLSGTMVINPILGRHIKYEFRFTGDDGKAYRFSGQKDVSPLRPVGSMTTLPGAITDENGAEIASGVVRFDLRTLGRFLGSFRPLL